jgi:predicted dehydrogenase
MRGNTSCARSRSRSAPRKRPRAWSTPKNAVSGSWKRSCTGSIPSGAGRSRSFGPAIRTIQTIFTYNNSNPSDIRNRLDVGGGGIRDIGCYAVSSARFLMQAEPVRAVSLVERDPVFGTDRLASAILDFGGARCVFTVGTQSWPAQQVDAYGASGSLTIEVPFNTFPDVPARLTVRVGIGLRTVETGPVDQYLLEFEAFARAVREGTEVPTPPADAVANQKVLDALFRSESSGGWESV